MSLELIERTLKGAGLKLATFSERMDLKNGGWQGEWKMINLEAQPWEDLVQDLGRARMKYETRRCMIELVKPYKTYFPELWMASVEFYVIQIHLIKTESEK